LPEEIMISIVAFDADDTLWHTESLFQETQARLATILDRYAPHAEVAARLNLTERRNLRQFGYGIKGFILSMVETAIEISDSRVSAAEIHEIMMMGKAMLDAPLQLMEDVDAVLDALGAAYRLFLITKGDMLDQRTKIDRSGLADRFAHIEVVSEKDARTYRAIFAAHRVEPAQAMMVGNSVPSDILPVLEIGGHAVHIPYHVTADIERHSDLPTHPRFHQLTRIADLPALISRLDGEKR
jgi:putative hydrolase of the HAD superfamily